MFLKGFKFGMLLQFAVGPVCIYVFNQASSVGFDAGMAATLGVTLGDMLYIYLAIIGISKIVDFDKHKKPFTVIGALVILYFSLDIILSTLFGTSIIPKLSFTSRSMGSFIQAFILTVSSPITILFWSGVFTVKLLEDKLGNTELVKFATGAVFSTIVFLSFTTVVGLLLHSFLTDILVKGLNITVAMMLIYFAVMKILKLTKNNTSAHGGVTNDK